MTNNLTISELRKHPDILEVAERIATAPKVEGLTFSENYIAPIALALMSERERCAKIASSFGGDDVDDFVKSDRQAIADLIMGQS